METLIPIALVIIAVAFVLWLIFSILNVVR